MTTRKKSITLRALLVAMCFALLQSILVPAASAAQHDLELVRVSLGNPRGASDASALNGVSFVYDDVAGTISQVSATTTIEFKLGPTTALFDHRFSGTIFDVAGGSIAAATYECIDGTFGSVVGADLCANTSFGANSTNETTVDYSTIPGSRVVGGDDTASGPPQQLADYAATLISFDGSTAIIQTPAWAATPGAAGMELEFALATSPAYDLQLVRVSLGNPRGASNASGLNGVDFAYDDVAGIIAQVSPTTTIEFKLGPATALFDHRFSGAVFNLATATITAATYECVDGTFGSVVGADLCANTSFGANSVNETTVDYTTIPSTRNVGGDDTISGPQQELADYSAFLANFDGSTVIIQTPAWAANPGAAGMELEFVSTLANPPVDVPDIRGLDQASAEAGIVAAGLTLGTISSANHPSVPTGQIISQNPSACAACVAAESAVNFVVSLGPISGGAVSDQITGLMDDVSGLDLPRRLARSLTRKLDRTLVRVEQERYFLAKFNLYFFAYQVRWQSGRRIPEADAENLQAGALEIVDRLAKELSPTPESGLQQLTSQGAERSYYLEVPEDYSPLDQPKPLLFMFHGTGGTYDRFFPGGLYALEGEDLRAKVGNDAIMVFPNALPNQNGVNQWDRTYDFDYVRDVLDDLRSDLVFDENRVFATGHSSGAGFSHELGCRLGDVFRGVAPSAGALTSDSCIGSVAVMHIQSMNDTVVAPGITQPTRNFWVLYNGFEFNEFGPGTTDPCVDYSSGESLYPFQVCMHDDTGRGGHQWWTKAGTIWDFFATLPITAPTTEHPPGGGNGRVEQEAETTLSFTLEYPATIGDTHTLAAVIYPAGTQQPLHVGPIWFLNLDIEEGAATPGTQQSYQVDVQLFQSSPETPIPGIYSVAIVAYVVGGGFPSPLPGIDHIVLHDVEITNRRSPIVIEEILTLEVVQ